MSGGNVWFTSDLHLGHENIAILRGFKNADEHDAAIVENFNQLVGKRDKLFILGDVAWKKEKLKLLAKIPGVKELIIGNHDTFSTQSFLQYFNKVHGFRGYKGF